MAGIYIHIPFCKSKCAYCDFYSIALLGKKDIFIKALIKEIELQKNYLKKEKIETIYFGGGTPSILLPDEIQRIIDQLNKFHDIDKNAEITLEANPDDLTAGYLKKVKNIGINRLSIGVQSFIDRDLQLMKRRHTAHRSVEVVMEARECGYKNISADLIYGLPGMNLQEWKDNIDQLLKLNIQHISAYHLTIEPNTLFAKWHKKNLLNLPTDSESKEQFEILIRKTKEKGFIHYEISNFGLDGFFSQHNTNYWKTKKYLGLGPSAHSYNHNSRQWNISNVSKYIESIKNDEIPCERETLSVNDKFNEYIMTSLCTMWGIDLNKVENEFGKSYFDYLNKMTRSYILSNQLKKKNEILNLSDEGIFISDFIIRDLMII